jgi:hypothetical protein
MKKKIHFVNPHEDCFSKKLNAAAPNVREKMLNMQQEEIDRLWHGNKPPPAKPIEISTYNRKRQESRPRPVNKETGKGLKKR